MFNVTEKAYKRNITKRNHSAIVPPRHSFPFSTRLTTFPSISLTPNPPPYLSHLSLDICPTLGAVFRVRTAANNSAV